VPACEPSDLTLLEKVNGEKAGFSARLLSARNVGNDDKQEQLFVNPNPLEQVNS
jgi:hypothetical protein